MASQNYSHTAELMKASLPYFDNRTRSQVELFSKVLDLMGSLNSLTGRGSMVAYGYEAASIDVEGILNAIRPLCDKREREFVDRILNIFNIKRIFETYNNFMNMMNVMQEAGGFSFTEEGQKDDTENVTGNFTNNIFNSIFQGFNNASEMPEEDNNTPMQETAYDNYDSNEALHTDNYSNTDNYNNDNDSKSNREEAPHTGTNNTFKADSTMFDMFKGMVPPEQMSTFENLRMLFNTMSYDNNNKPNDGKEHEYG